ncbi:MAG: aldehyde dehydrogenase family protein, partial [Desulfobacula sp.]|nr:aldehyde dehydrogenase family protein [Desulfobacula sp.]
MMFQIFNKYSLSMSWRRKRLLKFAQLLEKNKYTWIDILVKEMNATVQFAEKDLEQALHSMRFPKYVLKDLNGRQPVGSVYLQYPANSPGVATGVSFAAAYLTGNDITIRISSKQGKITDFLYEMVTKAQLGGVHFYQDSGKKFIEQATSCSCNALHVFGHDRVYSPLEPKISKAIEKLLLDVFIAELAGKDAYLVHPNADINKAAKDYQIASIISSGQVCMSPEMVFIPEARLEEFISSLTEGLDKIKIGNPSEKDTIVGPLMNKRIFDNAEFLIEDALMNYNAEEILIENLNITSTQDNLMPPRLIIVKGYDAKILHEESFCPAYVVVPYHNIDDVYQHLKSMKYGLTMSVYGNKKEVCSTKRIMEKYIGIIYDNMPFY